jgi:hypothetical protein
MDKGKSSPASSAESLVTLQGTADRKETIKAQVAPLAITKYPREPGKSAKRKAIFEWSMTGASQTIEPHNNVPTIG